MGEGGEAGELVSHFIRATDCDCKIRLEWFMAPSSPPFYLSPVQLNEGQVITLWL